MSVTHLFLPKYRVLLFTHANISDFLLQILTFKVQLHFLLDSL